MKSFLKKINNKIIPVSLSVIFTAIFVFVGVRASELGIDLSVNGNGVVGGFFSVQSIYVPTATKPSFSVDRNGNVKISGKLNGVDVSAKRYVNFGEDEYTPWASCYMGTQAPLGGGTPCHTDICNPDEKIDLSYGGDPESGGGIVANFGPAEYSCPVDVTRGCNDVRERAISSGSQVFATGSTPKFLFEERGVICKANEILTKY